MRLARLTALICLSLAMLLALPPREGAAQSYPDYAQTTVNDYANLLSEAARARLHDDLTALRAETGIELTVLTLPRRADHDPGGTLESFATGLFNHWGIGDADRNDGILVLVLREDREMRIELGSGYAQIWDVEAHRIINRSFLPDFRDDRYEDGILTGVADIVETIARPFASGQPPPKGDESKSIVIGILMVLGFLVLTLRRRIADRLAALRRCPSCGLRRLSVDREVIAPASKEAAGRGIRHTRCLGCGYDRPVSYAIPRSGSSSSSGFGGGGSSGGGASGRW